MHRIGGRHLAGLAVLAIAFSLTACGPDSSTASSAPTQGSGSSAAPTAPASPAASGPPASGPSATAPPSTPAAQPSARFVPMQTSTGGEFASPTGNITCEIDNKSGLAQASCQTGSPARSVTLSAAGQYKTCTGEQCLGNAGEGTPTLAYGTATGVGPFRCESAATGITCTANGRGFQISTQGVTAISS